MATTPNNNPVPTPDNDDIIDLASIVGEVSKRGRKSEVDPEAVQRLITLDPGKGFYLVGSDMTGPDFRSYIQDKGAPKPKSDGTMETRNEAVKRATNGWQSRWRQRAMAIAEAAGVDTPVILWHKNGQMILGKPKG
jgi:hypothetical protein